MTGNSLRIARPGKSGNIIYHDNMNEKSLEKLTKSQLIKMLMETKKPKQLSKPKNEIGLEYLMDEDPLPGNIEQENPMEKSMREIRRKNIALIRSTRRVDKKYRELVHPESRKPKIKKLDRALRNYKRSYDIEVMGDQNPLLQINQTRVGIFERLLKTLQSIKGFKLLEIMKVTLEKTSGKTTITKTAYFNSSNHVVLNEADLRDALTASNEQIMNKIGVWISEGSGWTITSVDKHYVNIAKYKPMEGSSYIDLPMELKNKKAMINLKNKDNECFRWCHVRHLNPRTNNPDRISQSDRKYIENLNYSGITFPVNIKQMNKIEKQNGINVNVFSYENKQLFPIRISKEKNKDFLNLLLITENENQHYVLIKDFNKFMYSKTKYKARKHFCMYCLQCFSSERVLNDHTENCMVLNGEQAIKMPSKKDNILKFNNFHKQQAVPFVIYADFEAITERIQTKDNKDEGSYTEAYQKHVDCGYGYKVVCCYDDKFTKPVKTYRGEKAVHEFLKQMFQEVKYCKRTAKKHFNKPLKMTKDDERLFKKADKCHICDKTYTDSDIRVRDHCHITGKYRGYAHRACNLKLRINPDNIKIPVIFHNLRGYDSHFIMQEMGEIVKNHKYNNKEMNINVIPNNMEKYMAFMLGDHLTFIDSFQFMSSSLDRLVSNLPKDALKYTSKIFKGEKLDLMSKKGVYPYDYMDRFHKFDDTQLPSKEEFYSKLNHEHISDDDYEHAKKVWKKI